jgi:hypothetical protein
MPSGVCPVARLPRRGRLRAVRPAQPETFRQVGDQIGIPLELLTVIREAIAMGQSSPDGQLRGH